MARTVCHLETCMNARKHIWYVRLDPGTVIAYKPGQYLQVMMGEKKINVHSQLPVHPAAECWNCRLVPTPGNLYPGEVLESHCTHGIEGNAIRKRLSAGTQ